MKFALILGATSTDLELEGICVQDRLDVPGGSGRAGHFASVAGAVVDKRKRNDACWRQGQSVFLGEGPMQ